MSLLVIVLLLFFFRNVFQRMDKSNPTRKQIDAEIQATLRHAAAWILTEKKTEKKI